MSNNVVNTKNLAFYGFLAFPLAFAGMPIYIHAPDYYSASLGLSLSVIGTILLVLRFIDSIQDPIIGYVSDRYNGYRSYIMLLGAFLLGSGFFTLFNPVEDNLSIWFGVSILLSTTGFSILTINLNSLGGIWSQDYNEKTKISAVREGFGLIGLLFGAALPPLLISEFGSQDAYSYYSIAMVSVLILAVFIFLILWIKNFNEHTDKKEIFNLENAKKSIKKSKLFFTTYFVSVMASSIPAILIIFFVRDVLKMEEYLGLFLVLYFISGALSMPAWHKISKSKGKIKSWKYSMILAVVSFIWAYFLEEGQMVEFSVICILSGLAFGAELSLPPSILADKVDKSSATTEYSILTFLMKLSLAIAAGAILPFLEMQGFEPGAENSNKSLHYVSLCYAVIPCILKVAAVILVNKLNDNKGEKNEKYNSNDGGAYVSN